jgi:hypothetical protein
MSIKKFFTHSILSLSAVILLTACGGDSTPMGTQTPSQTQDTQAPTIRLNGEKSISLITGDTFTDPGATSADTVTVTSDVNTSKAGTYTITYTATNEKGKSTSIKRTVTIADAPSPAGIIPIDSNIELGGESNILYYVDPRPEENGQNRALRIDYGTMSYTSLPVRGINPHSIDRAGESDRFYIRTQNSYSFDVVNFNTGEVKTVPLGDHKPRAIGAYNKKYNLQLLSAKDMPVVDVIDVNNDRVIATLGDRSTYNNSQITSNAGSGSATGHAIWLDEDHFVLIDRVNRQTVVYKVITNTDGSYQFTETSSIEAGTAFHALERVTHPRTRKDLTTFYALGEGDLTKSFAPYILELTFDPKTGVLSRAKRENGEDRVVYLTNSTQEIDNVKPTTHHAGITPDGKYFVAPVFDGKVYFINRKTMKTEKILQAELGAAHVEFSNTLNLAIVTNHFAQELTIIDLSTLEVKKHLFISNHRFDPNNKHLLQPHFSYLSEDGRYFYTFATQDGMFLKIDLQTLEIVDRLHTGGAPEQAHS